MGHTRAMFGLLESACTCLCLEADILSKIHLDDSMRDVSTWVSWISPRIRFLAWQAFQIPGFQRKREHSASIWSLLRRSSVKQLTSVSRTRGSIRHQEDAMLLLQRVLQKP